jgi:hypothetical protein
MRLPFKAGSGARSVERQYGIRGFVIRRPSMIFHFDIGHDVGFVGHKFRASPLSDSA